MDAQICKQSTIIHKSVHNYSLCMLAYFPSDSVRQVVTYYVNHCTTMYAMFLVVVHPFLRLKCL